MAQALEESVRQLLLDVRREHPSASVHLVCAQLVEKRAGLPQGGE